MKILQHSLVAETREGQITILNEPTHSFGSADNLRTYDAEVRLDDERPTSIHGVRADGKWSIVFGAGCGGSTTIHQHSAIEVNGRLYLAVSNQVVCLNLATGLKEWSRCVDLVTCFGVHWNSHHQALISHGELNISRLSLAGNEIWIATGADIFTGDLKCLDNGIEVIDFDQTVYLFDYRTGARLRRS